MNEMYIVSFNSTHHAIRLDKLLSEASVRATTLPTPREITASCGISIRILYDDINKVIKVKETERENMKKEVAEQVFTDILEGLV